MARGSTVKRCPACRKSGVKCSTRLCIKNKITYYAVYRTNGKLVWEVGGPTKKDAQRLLNQRISEIANGTYKKPQKIRFGEFAEHWLVNEPLPRVKKSTFRGYQTDIHRHLNPVLGGYHLTDITPELIDKLLSDLKNGKGLDAKTVNNIRTTLFTIMKYARRRKYIFENPVENTDPYKVEHKEMGFLKPDEIGQLLKHAREPLKTLLLTAVLTGMRRSELLALQWGDIDGNSNTIFVRRSIYWLTSKEAESGSRWIFTSPKSKRSARAIVMTPMLKKALEIHHINAPINEFDLVFANREGNPVDADNMIKREFWPALQFAGLRHIRFHDLRHTYSTLLIAQKENLKFIQNQLGHASIQTTIDRYGHLLPVDSIGVGNKLDNTVFGQVEERVSVSV